MPKQNEKKAPSSKEKSNNQNVRPSNDQLGENAGEGRAYKEMGKGAKKV